MPKPGMMAGNAAGSMMRPGGPVMGKPPMGNQAMPTAQNNAGIDTGGSQSIVQQLMEAMKGSNQLPGMSQPAIMPRMNDRFRTMSSGPLY